MKPRRKTRKILVGPVAVGGGAPISVQGMTKSDSRDTRRVLRETRRIVRAGAEIVRIAIPNVESMETAIRVKEIIGVPVIADIHFQHRLALMAIRAGVDGVRINPGNIGGVRRVKEVAETAREEGVSLRIGINSGSLERNLRRLPVAEALVESALGSIECLEGIRFTNFKISLKSSDVMETIEAYRRISRRISYPLHVGITEAGAGEAGIVKSALGIGILLHEGIGDTIRVSLSGPAEDEVRVGWRILHALGLRHRGVELVACPTCARDALDIKKLVTQIERRLAPISEVLTVAVMGCAVNGPGEAARADIGLVGGRGIGTLYRNGRVIGRVKREQVVDSICSQVEEVVKERNTEIVP